MATLTAVALDEYVTTARATFSPIIVQSLPTVGMKGNVLYLIMRDDNETYDEWLWIDNAWEYIGYTIINLSIYYTKEETDQLLADLSWVGTYEDWMALSQAMRDAYLVAKIREGSGE